MGRSFYPMRQEVVVEDFHRKNKFFHAASNRRYEMIQRDGAWYQVRYQAAPEGSRVNLMEKRIDYVLGSGNHARTYLSLTADGRLLDLPVAWYAEGGGAWGMAPGYDRPDHLDFRREITFECIFCHNAYPVTSAQPGEEALHFREPLPQGIDCQRCHGPGGAHTGAARSGAPLDVVRAAIVNPARLAPARSLEICLQCHLESTSHRGPYMIRHYDRGPFSYRPGESLSAFAFYFDLPRSRGTDALEVNHAGYRLMNSACFLKSTGRLVCTTCHNPHEPSHDARARSRYTQACLDCHRKGLQSAIAAARHTSAGECLGCHMPKRRTLDAVHVVMTDHRIRRQPLGGDPLAPLQESPGSEDHSYLGEVRLLDPPAPIDRAEASLYLAVAQLKESANLEEGLPRLADTLRRNPGLRGEFYYELAEGYRNAGQLEQAIRVFEQARRLQPDDIPGLRNFASALDSAGDSAKAVDVLTAAVSAAPRDARSLNMLGSLYARGGRSADAVEMLRRAAQVNPDLPEIAVNLGFALTAQRDLEGAEAALRRAILLAPDFAVAHLNLGALLAAERRIEDARRELQIAARSPQPDARRAALRLLQSLAP